MSLLRRPSGLHLRVEDLASFDADGLGGRNRERRTVLLFEKVVSVRGLTDQAKDIGDRVAAGGELIRIAVDVDGHLVLLDGDETLHPRLREVNLFVGIDELVIGMGNDLNECVAARPLLNERHELKPGDGGVVEVEAVIIDDDAEAAATAFFASLVDDGLFAPFVDVLFHSVNLPEDGDHGRGNHARGCDRRGRG